MRHKDLIGFRFGKLTVIEKVESASYRSRFKCVCDCGNEKIVLGQSLLNGHVRSCGCLQREASTRRIEAYNSNLGRETHGEAKTRLYAIWEGMKTRCYKRNYHSFPNYGGRGISVCEEWKSSFLAFREWALSTGYNDSLTIDRIDVNGDYCPDNCRWTGHDVQAANKRLLDRNTSGFTGVSFNKKSGKYVAYISRNRETHHLGSFDKLEDAIAARKRAEKQLDKS